MAAPTVPLTDIVRPLAGALHNERMFGMMTLAQDQVTGANYAALVIVGAEAEECARAMVRIMETVRDHRNEQKARVERG